MAGRSAASQRRAATPSEPSPAVSGTADIPNAVTIDFAAAKRKRDHPYYCAVNMEQELFAYSDGTVWPIRNWFGVDAEPCAKEFAAVAIAGGDDPNKGPWFSIILADYGLGPLAATEGGEVA
jgi:hypothetical protein